MRAPLGLLVLAIACGPDPGLAVIDGAPGDGGAIDAPDGWAALDDALGERLDGAAAALVVFDRDDREVHRAQWSDLALDRRIAIGAAARLPTSLVLFEVARTGVLTLATTTGNALRWTGPTAAIRLDHLLSGASGLPREHACLRQGTITLAACVDALELAVPVAAVGARLDDGGTHAQVAARLAEVRSGRAWNALYREVLADRLGLAPEVTYFTEPEHASGQLNPQIDRGMRASALEYAAFVRVAFHRGVTPTFTLGTDALFEAQATEAFPDATVGHAPAIALGLRPGLGAWLACPAQAAACPVLLWVGAGGFTAWIDRATGYYAVLALDEDDEEDDDGLARGVELAAIARQWIEAQLAR